VIIYPMNITPIRKAVSDDNQRQQQREDERRNVPSLRELRRLAGR